jgi:DNA-directed RNA polymerase subunit omega
VSNVILRRQPKDLVFVSDRKCEILRGVYPELRRRAQNDLYLALVFATQRGAAGGDHPGNSRSKKNRPFHESGGEIFMARVTVEDCLEKIPNRFDLVMIASRRAKQLFKGAKPLFESENLEIVTALREIAAGKVRSRRPKPGAHPEPVQDTASSSPPAGNGTDQQG